MPSTWRSRKHNASLSETKKSSAFRHSMEWAVLYLHIALLLARNYTMRRGMAGTVILSLLVVCSYADVADPRHKDHSSHNLVISAKKPTTGINPLNLPDPSLPTNYGFINEPWTGDNRPYHAMRVRIDRLLAMGQNPDALLLPAKTAAQKSPHDPKAQFLWAYIAYQAKSTDLERALLISDRTRQKLATLAAFKKVDFVRASLAKALPPRAYDYSRIRFLVGATTDQIGEEIKPLGVRLLRRDPKDYAVESILISLLQPGLVPGDMSFGLALIKDSMRRYPARLEPHEQLCTLYDNYWSNNGFHRADAEKAITMYQAYLALLPANHPLRQNIIQDIQQVKILQAFEEEKWSKIK